jgi:hypothetical protein
LCPSRSGFTPLEQKMMDSADADRSDRVVAMREDFQRLMAERYKALIEQLTDREVLAFLNQAHVEPDITLEVFFIDRPLEGSGAFEVIDRGEPASEQSTYGKHVRGSHAGTPPDP